MAQKKLKLINSQKDNEEFLAFRNIINFYKILTKYVDLYKIELTK